MEDLLNDSNLIKEIMSDIHEHKLEAAEKWKEIQSQLAQDIVAEQQRILNAEKDQTIKDFYESQLIDIFSQFESMQNSYQKDLNAYLTANPGRLQLFEEMESQAKLFHGKRKPPPTKPKLPPVSFENEMKNLLERLSESGVNITTLTLFADRAFMYKGEIYTNGAKVLIRTRAGQGLELQAQIYNITEFEVTFAFDDKSKLTIKADDIIHNKVQLLPNPIN